MSFRATLAGILLSLSVLASLVTGFGDLPPLVPGVLQLASGALLWVHMPVGVRRQSLFLLLIGGGCLLVSPQTVPLATALSKNQQIIAMLAAIGLLRRVPLLEATEDPPLGRKALWQTIFGIHWMGSFINLSAMAIFADRMVNPSGRLGSFQGAMLARGFALAALWSPFFIAMGVALTYAPGADYRTLMLWGLPFSQILLACMVWQTTRHRTLEVAEFYGYPFRPAELISPITLAVAVLVGHVLAPAVSIVTLITLLAPCYALLANGRNRPIKILSQYVSQDLPRMGPEIALFAAAGVLGTGLSSLVAGHVMGLAGGHNEILLASAGLAAILAASSVGIHPVVGITVVGGVLAAANLPPDLLAMSFLMGWGLGVLINPISGIHLFLSGRYAFAGRNAWRWNFKFVAIAYVVSCAWMATFFSFITPG